MLLVPARRSILRRRVIASGLVVSLVEPARQSDLVVPNAKSSRPVVSNVEPKAKRSGGIRRTAIAKQSTFLNFGF